MREPQTLWVSVPFVKKETEAKEGKGLAVPGLDLRPQCSTRGTFDRPIYFSYQGRRPSSDFRCLLTFSTCSRLSSLLCRPWLLRRAESLSCVTPRSWPFSSAFSHSTWRRGREPSVSALSQQLPHPGDSALHTRAQCGGRGDQGWNPGPPCPGTRVPAEAQAPWRWAERLPAPFPWLSH